MKAQRLLTWLDKLFWPMVGIYLAYMLLEAYQYFTNLKYVVNIDFHYHFHAGKIAAAGVIMALAFLFKLWGKKRLAGILLAVPAAVTIGIFLLAISVWLFLAAAMILFG